METRANFVLIGLFTLAVIASAFGFVYWFQNLGTAQSRVAYRVIFEGPVSGLRTGAGVTFNGIRVGEVGSISVDDPQHVAAIINVDRTAPVRSDTRVGLEFQGLTGIAAVALRGGAVNSAALTAGPDGVPTLRADGVILDVTEAARSTLQRVDQIIVDNQAALKSALRSIDSFTQALARNSERFDNIMIGMERLSGSKDNDGELSKTAASIRELADNLDKRTEELTENANKFINAGVGLVSSGRRTLEDISRTVNNFDRNPSRVLFGASQADAPAPAPRQPAQRQPTRR
jgi:phospholipid/cholesterol/gamma-HCH transport system substrate-binding protein